MNCGTLIIIFLIYTQGYTWAFNFFFLKFYTITTILWESRENDDNKKGKNAQYVNKSYYFTFIYDGKIKL